MSSNLEVRINITNYNPHPENPNYTVFHFYRNDFATTFEELLKKRNIPFESFIEEGSNKTIYFYAVKNSYYKETVKINFEAIGKHREPLIPNKIYAYSLLIFVFILLVIALIGFFKS
jgi:hypothetical protein